MILDARGERLDVLRLNKTLSAVPAFEAGVRERADRISGFRHEAFSRIRSIENDRPTGTLLVTSDHVRGARLSTLLAVAEKRSVPIERPAAACLIRQLVRAAADWRDQMPDAVHGAIGPDRIMIIAEWSADSRRPGLWIRPRTTSLSSAALLGRTGCAAAGDVLAHHQRPCGCSSGGRRGPGTRARTSTERNRSPRRDPIRLLAIG